MRCLQPKALLCSLLLLALASEAQQLEPQDYLPPSFHQSRREAARKLMPERSVMAVFAAPTRTYSNDVTYNYHPSPDLYYFTGYKEPNALLLIFKEPQKATDGTTYNEIFFVQGRDPRMEQWVGRRLGPEGVQKKLGIASTRNNGDFLHFPIDFSAFEKVIFEAPAMDVADDPSDTADLYDLLQSFRKKAKLPAQLNSQVAEEENRIVQAVRFQNLPEVKGYVSRMLKTADHLRHSSFITRLMEVQDSTALQALLHEQKANPLSTTLYSQITQQLRGVKTPEEIVMIRKAVEISCMGQNEVFKLLRPGMSEREIQGLHEYVHKKYGAESVGYGSIIGAGENGCILHYMENNRTEIGNEMLLMDVGAEYHGYTADVTRTIPADGKFSVEEKAIYQLVYNAQEAAFKMLKDSVSYAALNQAARDVIAKGLMKLGIIKEEKEVRKYYPHGLGHHLGLDVHDKGDYNMLVKNMVFTIEPGIYIPPGSDCDKKWWGMAVRIEDDVLITQTGFELLSSFAPRSIEAVEKLMAEKSALEAFQLPALKSAKKAF